MSVACPYCRKAIGLKGVKPGRFQPTCPGCKKQFVLTVPDDPARPPAAAPLPTRVPTADAGRAAPAEAADPERTVAAFPAPPAVPSADRTLPAAPAPDGATGDWAPDPADRTAVFEPPGDGDQTVDLYAASRAVGTRAGNRDATTAGAELGSAPGEVPRHLGGYEIVRRLGAGGMGTVFLARQVSLDRPVALKVMNPRWAADPAFLARFTREAYAAAQLTHHNIVQIYDIGQHGELHYFSMEYVAGRNLADLVHEQGKLDVDVAAGYALQAARGLKYAHDRGMVHRDIKPDNLLLNDQGVVKVADLGLVKTPGAAADAEDRRLQAAGSTGEKLSAVAGVTTVGIAMGTPAYMAPEQGRNAATVDHRADIYSLGCTLYVMLTGRPPFTGKTAVEVITKHSHEPIVPPENFARRVPPEVSHIVLKMLQKRPEDRYADLGEVIADLEKFLGVQSAGPFTPQEEHANTLESAVKAFNDTPAARLRRLVPPAFLGACGFLALLVAIVSKAWAVGVLAAAALAVVFAFLIGGFVYRTHLFVKLRQFVLGSAWSDLATAAVGGLLGLALVWLLGLFWVLFVAVFVAAGAAAAYHILVERRLAEEREPALAKARQLVRNLRLKGLQEEALMQFVCQYGGEQWEELFEALFGYDMLVQARQRYLHGESARRRPRHAPWRDPLVAWIDARQRARQEAAEKKLLQAVEARNLQAQGVSAADAQARAGAAADAMVSAAAELKKEEPPAVGAAPRRNVKSLLDVPEQTYAVQAERPRKPFSRTVRDLAEPFIGWKVRFLVGAALVAVCLVWAVQNDLHTPFKDPDIDLVGNLRQRLQDPKPLRLPFIGDNLPPFLSGFNAGVAGLLLILSAGWRNLFVNAIFFPAAVVILFGPMLGVPGMTLPVIGEVSAQTLSLLAGSAAAVLGGLYYLLFYGEG